MTEPASGTPTPGKPSTRHFPRYRIDVRVLAKVRRDSAIVVLRGRSTDISESGMGATLSGDLELGEVAELEFALPLTREPLHLRVVVRRRNGLNYGVEFLTLSAQQRAAIQRLHSPLGAHD
ncbi:MAG TPA: PilZ domain-containing protein [Terriglobales bacterium]|jgi:c-di-GMP-binding flagellar brake protein YcgR|nr:PilZ domain-containing protein [Terriglobales bacterium]